MQLRHLTIFAWLLLAVMANESSDVRYLSLADDDFDYGDADEDDTILMDFFADLPQKGRQPTIRMESLDPPRGPIRGETRILVRTGPLSMWKHKYTRPQCKVGNDILAGTYVSCPQIPKHISALEHKGLNNDYICIFCDITKPRDHEESVEMSVSLTGDFTDVQNKLAFEYYNEVIVTQIRPRYGPKDGGTRVHVYGQSFKNYTGAVRCAFGTKSVLAEFISDRELVCESPPSDVVQRAQPFSVSLNDQQFSKSEIDFAYFNFPQVFQVTPNRGPEDDHTLIEVRGANFKPFKPGSYFDNWNDTYCQFIQLGQKSLATVKDANHLTCRTPTFAGIHVTEVEVTLNNQETTEDKQLYTFYKAPIIYQATPGEGPVNGGTLVTLQGTDFENSGSIKCYFGENEVPGKFISFQEIQCVTPPAKQAGYVDLYITIRPNQSSKKFKFLYYDKPVLGTMGPMCGPDIGFTQIEIHGKNFVDLGQNKARCVFNNSIFTFATIYSMDTLYCDSPPFLNKMGYSLIGQNGANGDFYNVSVTLDGGNDLSQVALPFHYYKQPKVNEVLPYGGPITGGTPVTIKVTGLTQPHLCGVRVRFANMDLETKVVDGETLSVVAPKVDHPGTVVVQVAYNEQQFSKERIIHLKDLQASYEYYQNPLPIFHQPNSGPSTGGTMIQIKGLGLLANKPQYGVDENTDYQGKGKLVFRFVNPSSKNTLIKGTAVYEVNPEDISNVGASIRTPAMPPNTKTLLQISRNGHDWVDVVDPNPAVTHSFETYQAPHVTKIDPPYGPVKPTEYTLMTISGTDFRCVDEGCKKVSVRFENARGETFFAPDATWKNKNTIVAQVPKYTEPDVLTVEVSMNGDDYTSDKLTYGYYDPYVLDAHPRLISTQGTTRVRVKGIGFVDSHEVKVHYSVLTPATKCSSQQCIKEASFISSSEIEAPTYPQSQMLYQESGASVMWSKFDIQVSVHQGEHTQNEIYLQYFTQPTYTLLSPAETAANIPVYLLIRVTMEERDVESIRKHGKPMCRFTGQKGNVQFTEGILTFSEKAKQNQFETSDPSKPNAIRCPTPIWQGTFNAKLDLSVNDYDYSGNIEFVFSERLKLDRVAPISGPINSVTHSQLLGSGFQPHQDSKLVYKAKWGVMQTDDVVSQSVKGFSYTLDNWLNIDSHVSPQLKCYWYEAADIKRVDSEITKGASLQMVGMPSAQLLDQTPASFRRLGEKEQPSGHLNKINYNVTLGGPVYLEIGRDIELDMTHHESAHHIEDASQFIYHEYLPSAVEFYHYKQCTMLQMYPTHGITKGGTQVQVTGYDFRYWPEWGVVPMCKFGDKVVKGHFDSTVRIVCETPPVSQPVANLSFEVSLNGMDWTETGFTYTYYLEPKILDYWPNSGKALGGTEIFFYGQNFPNIDNPDDYKVRFRPQKGRMSDKFMPVTWLNSTCVKTITPGGWTEGDMMDLQLTFNGNDFDNNGFTFTFYNVDEVFPRSGPSDGSGGEIFIRGQGFRAQDKPKIMINNTVYEAKGHSWNEIRFPMPAARDGPDFFGNVPLEVSVNDGAEWIVYESGFQFYKQPVVKDIWPKTGPAYGAGSINFYGEGFRSDFSLAELKCKVGDSLGIAFFINENQVRCIVEEMQQVEEGQKLPAQLALNGYSWTKTVDNSAKAKAFSDVENSGSTFFVPYMVQSIVPASGYTEGGSEVIIIGSGFQETTQLNQVKPRCRFGSPLHYSITEAQVISYNKMACISPPADSIIGETNTGFPHSVPFSVAFSQDSYDPWTYTHHQYMYYNTPLIDRIEPDEVDVGMIKEIIVSLDWSKTDRKTNFFFEPPPIEASRYDMIGAQNSETSEISAALLIGNNIKCKFGHFGETIAAYVNATTIKCVTPSLNVEPEDVYIEKVQFMVSMNGYDYNYEKNQHLIFTFVGTGSYLSLGFIMLAAVLAVVLILAFVLFVQSCYMPSQFEGGYNDYERPATAYVDVRI